MTGKSITSVGIVICLLGNIHAIHDLKRNIVASIRHEEDAKAGVEQLQTFGAPVARAKRVARQHAEACAAVCSACLSLQSQPE